MFPLMYDFSTIFVGFNSANISNVKMQIVHFCRNASWPFGFFSPSSLLFSICLLPFPSSVRSIYILYLFECLPVMQLVRKAIVVRVTRRARRGKVNWTRTDSTNKRIARCPLQPTTCKSFPHSYRRDLRNQSNALHFLHFYTCTRIMFKGEIICFRIFFQFPIAAICKDE